MNAAKEMNDAITKVYEQVNPVLAAVQATFPNENICIRPEIGLDRTSDGKMVGTLRSIQFFFGVAPKREIPSCVDFHAFDSDLVEAANLLKKLVASYGLEACEKRIEEFKRTGRFGDDMAEAMNKVFQTIHDGCYTRKEKRGE